MFRCGLCKMKSKSGEKAERVVLETREKQYLIFAGDEESPPEYSTGWETVKETIAHVDCAEKFRGRPL